MAVTKKYIPVLGEDYVDRAERVARAYLYGTDADTTGTFDLFQVKEGTFVHEVRTCVNSAFNASVTITIGDSDDPDGWLTSAVIAPQTAVTTGLFKSSATADSDNAYGIAGGKYYSNSQPIQAVFGGTAPTQGKLEVLVYYTVLEGS